MKDICFHHNDADGRLSAAIIKKVYPKCEFIEINYGYDEETVKNYLSTNVFNNIFVVDFSFTPEIMNIMAKGRLCWIDHHVSAKKKMLKLWNSDEIDGIRDITKAGCMLTWEWFYPHEKAPTVVEIVQDCDLWKHEREDSKYFSERMFNEKYLNVFKELLDNDAPLITIIKEGRILFKAKENRVEKNIKCGYEISLEGYRTLVINTSEDVSYLGNKVCKEYSYDIALMYRDLGDRIIVNLRSVGDVDVSIIAVKYGGGGHKNAAGMTLKTKELAIQRILKIN